MDRKLEKSKEEYHKTRRIFAIIDNKLRIAREKYPGSHDEWFIEKGWIKDINDSRYEEITRGMIAPDGDIYFYVGKELRLTDKAKKEFLSKLKELAEKFKLSLETEIFGGMIKKEVGVQWPGRELIGVVGDYL